MRRNSGFDCHWLARRTIGVLFGMLVIIQAHAQQLPACGKLKEGKFKIEDKVNGTSIITRSHGVQREENEQMGIVVEYLTEWLDDCSFRLVPFKVIRNDNNLDMDGDLKLEVEIVEISDSTYTQITTAWATGQNETEVVKIIR
jgi:hypothetical protein